MLRVGIDVGGTFTDLFTWDEETGAGRAAKSLTTPHDLTEGVFGALEVAGVDLSEVDVFVHGSTTAINALLERKYPEPALITTVGFRDTIEIGRQRRPHLYEPYQVKPAPIVRRRHRFVVAERIDARGDVIAPLDEAAVTEVARRIREAGIRSVAIAFVNSYANPEHERRARDLVLAEYPEAHIALSSDVPKYRELGRFSTAAVRAALLPVLGDYLERLEGRLREAGFNGTFYVIKSNGGLMRAAHGRQRPEELIQSGPAGAVATAAHIVRHRDRRDIVSTDMGGTSFDVCLIDDGKGTVRDDYEVAWDTPVITPMLDIRSVGAGGGSIAWVDDGGSLRVGPRSAGSTPGPVCYGRGGTEPTVTDANLVLGRLDPTLGGKMALDVEGARAAIARVGEQVGLDVVECAAGIIRICAETMASAIKMILIDRGRDPRDYAMAAFGGAGALHSWLIANSLGIEEVIVPPFAGVASAFGATVMDVRHDVEATSYAELAGCDLDALNARFAELERQVAARFEGESAAVETIRSAGIRYVGQSYEVQTPIPAGTLDASSLESIAAEFNRIHLQEHGVASESFALAFVTLRVTAVGRLSERTAARPTLHLDARAQGARSRAVYFDDEGFLDTPIVDAAGLKPGESIAGPAVIESTHGVVIVPPAGSVLVDEEDNLVLTLAPRPLAEIGSTSTGVNA
jgi:N-methylhydantoinase A